MPCTLALLQTSVLRALWTVLATGRSRVQSGFTVFFVVWSMRPKLFEIWCSRPLNMRCFVLEMVELKLAQPGGESPSCWATPSFAYGFLKYLFQA